MDPQSIAVTIAGLQSAGRPGDIDGNLEILERAASDARAHGADLLITPEMFLTGYNIGPAALGELASVAFIDRVAQIARRHRIAVVLGAPDRAAEGIYNAAFFFDDVGRVIATHRKAHLFGDLDRAMFLAGDRLVACADFRGVRIAMCICYDVEFPETVRAAADAGAHLLAVPTAQMTPYAFIADQVVRTRAWENQIYLAYVNRDGVEGDLTYVGRSSIVAPDASVLDAIEHGEGLIYAEVAPAVVAAAQEANPYLADRRIDLYTALDGDAQGRSDPAR